MKPHEYPRRILLALTGLSPQVVTETIYALAQQDDPYIPTEIHLFTTMEGIKRATLTLLSETPGWFHRLSEELGLPEIEFNANTIHVPKDAGGSIVKDMRTQEDNQHTADDLLSLISQFTADENCSVHISISGGRKTMGFYAGYALSLYGREQDRLSHVLVSENFESHTEFYFPTKKSNVIYVKEDSNRPIDTRDAVVTLADIPFVRMREGLPSRLLEGRVSFSETVRAAQLAQETPSLILNVSRKEIVASGERFTMSPAEFAFFYWFAKRQKEGLEPVRWTDEDLHIEFLNHFHQTVSEADAALEQAELALANGMDRNYFDQRKSRTNTKIRAALGAHLAGHYEIQGQGERGHTKFGLLSICAEQIEFKN